MGSRKAASNLTAHGVAFEEAATVFAAPLAMMHSDPDHSLSERHALLTVTLDAAASCSCRSPIAGVLFALPAPGS
jgi:uncharacterized DUF497 family protein